ncbi:STAS domain-containing protein [Streptomyces sp. NPDC087440]|uniref:STAS domain-containing protein n=1 Tax=Streptomyces sp. NPDC087440 TaxID=3365790 RepID=UPI00380700A1
MLRFRGELDFESVVQFQEAAATVLADGPVPRLVVVDCAGLEFCDSSGISELVRFYLRLTEAGSRLRMAAVPTSVGRVFELTGLDRAITLYDDAEAALADVSTEAALADLSTEAALADVSAEAAAKDFADTPHVTGANACADLGAGEGDRVVREGRAG